MKYMYEVVIPTYDRVDILGKKTLKFLKEQNIPKERITLFVANEEELKKYSERYTDYKIIKGVKGLANQLNFIYDKYPKGTFILRCDDDIRDICDCEGKSIKLSEIMKRTNDIFKQEKIRYGGFYPVFNKMFMKQSAGIKRDLRHIVGVCNFFINSEFRHSESVGGKEDYEKTLYHYVNDGKLLRWNDYGIKTTYYSKKGGLANQRTDENEKEEALMLESKYPEYVTLYEKKGRTQIRLRKG